MTMEFKDFMVHFINNAKSIFDNSGHLFLVDLSKDELWEKYLDSFPAGKNEVYRTRREFDCSCCKSFIRQFGNVVSIQDNKIVTMWDFHTNDDTYEPVLNALSKLVNEKIVSDVFVTKQNNFGTVASRELLENQLVHVWNHFYVDVPKKFVSTKSESVNEEMASYRDIRNVFKRSLDEISTGTTETVLDMIAEGNLYRGEEWKAVLEKFLNLQKQYKKIKTKKEKENFCWSQSVVVGGSVGKIRNHSIGTLLIDIENEVDVDEAVRKYEVIIAPTNYKRPKAIFTKKMIEQAQKTIEDLGLLNSLGRRHAVISDITVNNVLWANRNAKKAMKNATSVFEELKNDVAVNPKSFELIQGIPVKKFIEEIGSVKSLEVLLENRHSGNLMSLIAPEDKEGKTLFKWNNNFSWSYNGNVADSMMKERVKSAGGKVDGVLRFSLQWNTKNENKNDFDAHCIEPNGNEIFFRNKNQVHSSTGILDVDIIHPTHQPAVENITWSDVSRMRSGIYKFFVHCYSHNGGRTGFEAEIEFDGQIYEFSYNKELKTGEKVVVAEVTKNADGSFSMGLSLPSNTSTKTIWNLKTNQFVPVSICMLSPNHWNDEGVGNKHYFFMLSNCVNETNPNGFYNEYLNEGLMKHKRVFEALGAKMKVADSENQLSGIGFSSTKKDYLIVKADGKIMKVIF